MINSREGMQLLLPSCFLFSLFLALPCGTTLPWREGLQWQGDVSEGLSSKGDMGRGLFHPDHLGCKCCKLSFPLDSI